MYWSIDDGQLSLSPGWIKTETWEIQLIHKLYSSLKDFRDLNDESDLSNIQFRQILKKPYK
jgi:hypothetical protein